MHYGLKSSVSLLVQELVEGELIVNNMKKKSSGMWNKREICERFTIRHVEPQAILLTEAHILCFSLTVFAVKFHFINLP